MSVSCRSLQSLFVHRRRSGFGGSGCCKWPFNMQESLLSKGSPAWSLKLTVETAVASDGKQRKHINKTDDKKPQTSKNKSRWPRPAGGSSLSSSS